jgi:hypothetical protein
MLKKTTFSLMARMSILFASQVTLFALTRHGGFGGLGTEGYLKNTKFFSESIAITFTLKRKFAAI